jgi:hypothetical protein
MSSDDRQTRRKYLEARIAENRQRLMELFGKAPVEPPPAPRGAASAPDMRQESAAAASAAQAFASAEAESEPARPTTFPRSRTMRWAMDHPVEAAAVGVVGAALLGMGPVQLARWLRSSKSVRASAGFMRGVRDGAQVMQPLVPLLTAWLGHKWRSAERDEIRAQHHASDPRSR